MTVKETLYLECKNFIDSRMNTVLERIASIQESLQSETKSSAGDKHETGRAMLQLEREKAGNQLKDIQKQQETLAKVTIGTSSDVIRLGSLVKTDKANYFIAISLGKVCVGDEVYFAISPSSPIGKKLLGKCENLSFMFSETSQRILEIT